MMIFLKHQLGFMQKVALKQRELAAFYTPVGVSEVLSEWAIRSPSDLVLEPSFGGCGFIKSSIDRLTNHGNIRPQDNIHGCDIDPVAFSHLSDLIGVDFDTAHFLNEDFLVPPTKVDWVSKFGVVIGNPPYLSYHKVDPQIRAKAVEVIRSLGVRMNNRASLWAYFVLLSVQYLSANGRMAWVLPGSLLQADYATDLRRYLVSHFHRVRAFSIHERLFLNEGTDEETAILLAEGFSVTPRQVFQSDIPLTYCHDLEAFKTAVWQWNAGHDISEASCLSPVGGRLSNVTRNLIGEVADREDCGMLGDYLNVRIGVVTGDNPHFLLSRPKAQELGIAEKDLEPILAKFGYFDGLEFHQRDYEALLGKGAKALMVSAKIDTSNPPGLQAYLDSYPESKKKSIGTFRKRRVWCCPQDGNIPDAFFPVMHHHGPRLILNRFGSNCTNTLHRVFFKMKLSEGQAELISISLLTSYSQISAEIVGRKYGSGVLKHEPRDAEKISVVLPKGISLSAIIDRYADIDQALRAGDPVQARELADDFIFRPIFGASHNQEIRLLSDQLTMLRESRVPDRKKKTT